MSSFGVFWNMNLFVVEFNLSWNCVILHSYQIVREVSFKLKHILSSFCMQKLGMIMITRLLSGIRHIWPFFCYPVFGQITAYPISIHVSGIWWLPNIRKNGRISSKSKIFSKRLSNSLPLDAGLLYILKFWYSLTKIL